MNNPPLWQKDVQDLGNALDRLKEILAQPLDKHDFILDGTIKRFEFTYEICWKTLKRLLLHFANEDMAYPKLIFQAAYRLRWIEDEAAWIAMQQDRNLSSHVYNEDKAHAIYARIPAHYRTMQLAYESLKQRFGGEAP
jgi:nucleotidyltransferase substrate binding protein (TIGR01987 family)